MATFVIETYLSRTRAGELDQATQRLRDTIARASTRDRPMRHVRSFYVPDDEMAIHLIEAVASEDAKQVIVAAGLAPDRIVEAEAAAG